MATGFGNWANSLAAHQVLTQIAQREVERMRPATRMAEVVSIDKENRSLDVKFIGEQEAVRVPYTSTAPANPGQYVMIGGTTHDRHVEDVIGQTDVDSRLAYAEEGLNSVMVAVAGDEWANDDPDVLSGKIEDFFGNLGIDIDPLLQALRGQYTGSDPFWIGVQKVARTFSGNLVGGDWFNLGQLSTKSKNLLPSGDFNTEDSVVLAEGWSHDPSVGSGSGGSAKYDLSYGAGALYPPQPAGVVEGNKYTPVVEVRWEDVVGAGDVISPVLRWFSANDELISEVAMPKISNPPPSSGGSFVRLSGGKITAPAGARYARILFQTSSSAEGFVWWDRAGIWSEEQTLPQHIIEGLVDALTGLLEWIGNLVDSLLLSVGMPPLGSLGDRISDLSDEFGDWLDRTEEEASKLFNLISNLLSNPASVLGNLPQSKIVGLANSLANKANVAIEDFLLDLANAILSGIRKVPIVGGSIANRIEDVLDDLFDLKSLADDTAHASQELQNEVWRGASGEVTDALDRTANEVKSTVAELRAAQDRERTVRELVATGAQPLWMGPASSGDVTIPLGSVLVPRLLSTLREQDKDIPISGRTGSGDPFGHDHSQGTLKGQMTQAMLNVSSVGAASYASTYVFNGITQNTSLSICGAFIAASDIPRKFVTFLGTSVSVVGDNVNPVIKILKYDADLNLWFQVAKGSAGISSNNSEYMWVNAELEEEFVPEISGLYLVCADVQMSEGSGAYLSSSILSIAAGQSGTAIPPYPMVPYGMVCQKVRVESRSGAANPLTIISSIPLDAETVGVSLEPMDTSTGTSPNLVRNVTAWSNSGTPFFQISPDLGQVKTEIQPRFWYDDFNKGSLSTSSYSPIQAGFPSITNGVATYGSSSNGVRGAYCKTPMATDNVRAEITLASTPNASEVAIGIGNNIFLAIKNNIAQIHSGPPLGSTSMYAQTSINSYVGDRWALERNYQTGTVMAFRNGVNVTGLNLTGHSSSAMLTPKGATSFYLSRGSGLNSCSVDDFLARDV